MKTYSLHSKYQKRIEISFIITLCFQIFLFSSFTKFEFKPRHTSYNPGPILLEKVTVPEQEKSLIRPDLPEIPVEGPDDETLKYVTIRPQDINYTSRIDTSIPPPDSDPIEVVPFEALSEVPKLIYRVRPEYPNLARVSGIQGTVIVEVLLGTNGRIEETRILKSNPMLDEAALTAVRQFRFSPAMQRDKCVRVRMCIPIVFKLH
jgi:protein TonB